MFFFPYTTTPTTGTERAELYINENVTKKNYGIKLLYYIYIYVFDPILVNAITALILLDDVVASGPVEKRPPLTSADDRTT